MDLMVFVWFLGFHITTVSSIESQTTDAFRDMLESETIYTTNDVIVEEITLAHFDENTEETEDIGKVELGPLGKGKPCVIAMFTTHAHLYVNTSAEFKICRCYDICPNSTQEELNEIYESLAMEVDVHWNKYTISYVSTYSVVLFVGTIGNLLVLLTIILIFRPLSVTNLFIASLAVADLLVCSICVPLQMYRYILRFWKLGEVTCVLSYYSFYAFFMASVFSLTAMSLERFFVICYPMKAQYVSTPRRAKIITAIVWPLAFIMALPVLFQAKYEIGKCRIIREMDADDWSGPLFLYITCALFAVPGVVIGYAYIRTAIALLRSVRNAKAMTNKDKEEGKKQSNDVRARLAVIRMLIAVWLVFIVCWGPYLIMTLLGRYAQTWLYAHIPARVYNHLYPALHLVTMGNSALNPILYAFLSRQFRRGFMKCFLCCLAPVRSRLTSSTASSSTLSRTRSTKISA